MFASLGRIYSRFSLATGENSNEELCLSYRLLALVQGPGLYALVQGPGLSGARTQGPGLLALVQGTRIPEALSAVMTHGSAIVFWCQDEVMQSRLLQLACH